MSTDEQSDRSECVRTPRDHGVVLFSGRLLLGYCSVKIHEVVSSGPLVLPGL